jgi:nicotinamide-nucleotide adenylyltransferase
LAAKALCRHLVVGITNPDPFMSREETADPHRSAPLANPLTYYERHRLVRSALAQAGVHPQTFSIVPLPINLPERYRYYVPLDAVFFLSIYDDWGRKKLAYFQSLGLATHVLWEVQPEQKGISSRDIRSRMIDGRPWEHLVPPCVAEYLHSWDIARRLAQIKAGLD